MPKRLSVPLSPEVEESLNQLAQELGMSMAETAQNLLAVGILLEAFRLKGGDVIYRDPDGREQVLSSGLTLEPSLLRKGAREHWFAVPRDYQYLVWLSLTKEEQQALLALLPSNERENILTSLSLSEQKELAIKASPSNAIMGSLRLPQKD